MAARSGSEETKESQILSEWNLWDEQKQAVHSLLSGKDVLAILPTGFGKSRIFHAFASMKDKELSGAVVVLVITPLSSIAKDQLDYLNAISFPAANLAGLSTEDLHECKMKFLFGSAEDVATDAFRNELKDISSKLHQQLACIVVDESHTIETWAGKREVMVIVQIGTKYRKSSENIDTNDLKPYQTNTQDPYVTAYLKANVLKPLTFVIGDGKKYNSEKVTYFNQPLKQNSNYIVFLRFFESKDSFYSTVWSSSVRTMVKPPAPKIKIISTGLKNYIISWSRPVLPDKQTVLKYYISYILPNGSTIKLNVSKETTSLDISVEFEKQYTFKIKVETEAGRSNTTSESWLSHSEPLKSPNKTKKGYTVFLKKPKDEQRIKKVALVVLQLKSKSSILPPPEDLNSKDKEAFTVHVKEFPITIFKNETLEILLLVPQNNERRKRRAIDVNIPFVPNAAYATAQRNEDESGKYFWSYWNDPIVFIKVPSGSPLNVALRTRGKNSLEVSWKAPAIWNGEQKGYQVCYSDRATSDSPTCTKTIKKLSYTMSRLLPSTKYFVTVSAATNDGAGPKSLEVSKITNGEPVNPLTTSYYTLSLNIPKPKDYIREVMVIVQNTKSSSTLSENLRPSDLKAYQENMKDPYVTAYLKADVLPLTFVIGDGKEYNFGKEKYFNQPLQLNSSYIVFLRFFESQGSYYSTEWSSDVKTLIKAPVECDEKTRIDLLIPLVILVLCFLLSLGVNIYQRRLIQNKNRQPGHKRGKSEQKEKFDLPSSNKAMKGVQAAQRNSYVNDDAIYESPDDVLQCIERNEAESKPEISTGQESSTYMSLKDNKEPGNFYQSLQPPGTSAYPHHTKGVGDQAVEYENPAFNANCSDD